MKYLWTEDTGAGLHFWELVNQLFFDDAFVIESKGSNQGLLDALSDIDMKEDDKYYIAFDYVVDNQDIRNKYRILKSIADKAEGKIIILNMICFEYLILAFDKLVAWTGTGKTDKIKIREEVLSAIEDHRIKLFISFLKKQNGKFNFDEPCALIQFDAFKRFYINELGKLARYYFELIEHKARDINTYTYEIDSYSNAARVFLSTQRRSFYEQMVIEQNSIKELLLYMYKNKRESGAFRLLNDMESLEMDDALVNDYLADLCEGKVNNWLIDYVDELYEEMEDIKKRKERKELLALIGNRSVLFDFDDFEDDENESYHRNMFESDDIEGGENL